MINGAAAMIVKLSQKESQLKELELNKIGYEEKNKYVEEKVFIRYYNLF